MKILTNSKYNGLLSEIKNLELDIELYQAAIKEKSKDLNWANQHNKGLRKEIAELRKTKYALWMARTMRNEDKAYNATEEILHYRAEHPDTKLYPSTPFIPAEIAEWKRRWQWAERKCLAKAKEFE